MESVKRVSESESESSKPTTVKVDQRDCPAPGASTVGGGVRARRSWIAPRLESLGKVEEMTHFTMGT